MCSFRSCQTRFEFLSQFRKVRNAFECFITQVQTRLPKTKCVWPMKINVICTVYGPSAWNKVIFNLEKACRKWCLLSLWHGCAMMSRSNERCIAHPQSLFLCNWLASSMWTFVMWFGLSRTHTISLIVGEAWRHRLTKWHKSCPIFWAFAIAGIKYSTNHVYLHIFSRLRFCVCVLNVFYFQTDINFRFKRKRDVRLTCKRVWCILHRTL